MSPHRLFHNPYQALRKHVRFMAYTKIAVIGAILSVGVTLANNERTDARVRALARENAKQQVLILRAADRKVQAVKDTAAKKQAAATAYVINFAACGARTLVDPTIKSNEGLIVALKRAINDPTSKPAVVRQSKVRLKAAKRSNAAFKAYRGLYRTVPDNFDCSKLPDKPPS